MTLPNSNTPSLPPGFRTRYASLKTAGRDVQLRIPNAIVYRSMELSAMCEGRSCALPWVKLIWGATVQCQSLSIEPHPEGKGQCRVGQW